LSLYKNGIPTGIRDITSVCIRVARDFPGIAKNVPGDGSVIILGAPGWGKTTLLRDLIRMRSEYKRVCVVDERGELFPEGLDTGKRTDILRGCQKCHGIEQVLRTMGPGCIAVDEITASEDCACLIRSAGCGAELLATAHAETIRAFHSHPRYHSLIHSGIFQWILMLRPDKQFSIERMVP
jgi:stage III sporulation protein AA